MPDVTVATEQYNSGLKCANISLLTVTYLICGELVIIERKYRKLSVGKPRTDSVPPTMQSQIPKSRDVTLFFFRHDALQVSGHTLFTSTPHVFILNIFINKTERSIHFY